MTTQPNQPPQPAPNGSDSGSDRVLMRFGPAPALLSIVGAIAGGVVMVVFQDTGLAGILGGAVLGLGTGWLLGLIIAMAFLGE